MSPFRVSVLLFLFASSSPSWAGPDDRALSVTSGFTTYLVEDSGAPGLHVGLEYDRGLTNSLWLHTQVAFGTHFGDGDIKGGSAMVSIRYALDVIKYVPYVDLGVGAALFTENLRFDTQIEPMIRVGLGLDILISRRFSYGAYARFDSFLSDSGLFSAGLRGSYRWGFF